MLTALTSVCSFPPRRPPPPRSPLLPYTTLFRSALGPHYRDFGGGPGEVEVGQHVLGRHDIVGAAVRLAGDDRDLHPQGVRRRLRSEEHTSELQSQSNLVCRLLLEKKKQRLNTCHSQTSYAVFCSKNKNDLLS